MSSRGPVTCDDASRLTRCHRAFVSNSCHFFRTPLSNPLATYPIAAGRGTNPRKVPSRDGYPRRRSRIVQRRWEMNDPAAQRIWHHLPVTLRIRTWRICRVVQAFNRSGAHVYSAEFDSAGRCKHGEFESSHAQVSSLLVRRGIGRSRRAHHAAPGDGSWRRLAAQLLIMPTLEQLGGGPASGCNTGTGLTT